MAELFGPAVPWLSIPAPLAWEVTLGLWILCLLNLVFGGWLLLVRSDAVPCSGLLCIAVTLGGHPTLTLVLAEGCAATLGALLPVRGGLPLIDGPRLGVVVVAVVCGAIALAGPVALLLGVALCFLVVAGVLLTVFGCW